MGHLDAWKVITEKELFTVDGRLRVTQQRVLLPTGQVIDDYLRVYMRPFVTIFAVTRDTHVICERQYKHGPQQHTLTAPGGGIEAGESPEESARRELLEETGYRAEWWQKLGEYTISGNSGVNQLAIFMALDCVRVAEPISADLEDIAIELVRPSALFLKLMANQVFVATDALTFLQGSLELRRQFPSDYFAI